MKKNNLNFIPHSFNVKLYILSAFILLSVLCSVISIMFPSISHAQATNSGIAGKRAPSAEMNAPSSPQPPSSLNRPVSAEDTRNQGFAAPSINASQSPMSRISPMPIDTNFFGQKIPQSYADWVDYYKLKYASSSCPSQKCILLGSIEVSKSPSSSPPSYSIRLSGYSYLDNQRLVLPAAYDEKSRRIWPSSVQLSNLNKTTALGSYSENLDSSIILNKGDWIATLVFDAPSVSFMDTKGPYAIFLNTSPEAIDYNYAGQKLSFNKAPPTQTVLANKSDVQLSAKVYRLYSETRPAQLQTQLQITYFGPSQEVKLGKIIPPDFSLSSYSSVVPLRFDSKSRDYYAFLNPGNWTIYLNAHTSLPTDSIKINDLVAINAAKNEVWSVSPQPTIRQFEVLSFNQKSAQSVDPKMAYVPAEWARFNAYNVEGEINFKTVNKASTEDNNNSLKTTVNNRVTWIGLDSRAINKEELVILNEKNIDTAQLNPSVVVETALSNQKPQLIFKDMGKSAISIMPGSQQYSLLTTSSNNIPLSSIDNAQVNKINNWDIHLAPRTRLVSYKGADYIAGSWINNWNLYAVFGLFLITLSFYKLFGWPSALICFVGIAVNIHNSFLAWTVWPSILICMALIKVLNREKEKPAEGIAVVSEESLDEKELAQIEENSSPDILPSPPVLETKPLSNSSNKLQTLLRVALFFLLISMGAYSTFLTINEVRSIINPSLESGEFYVTDALTDNSYAGASNNRAKSMIGGMGTANKQYAPAPMVSSDMAVSSAPASIEVSQPTPQEIDALALEQKQNSTQAMQSKNQVSSGAPQWLGNSHRVGVSNFSSKDVLSLYIAPVWLVNIMGLIQVFVAWLICAFMLSFILLNNLFTPPKFIQLERYFLDSWFAKKVWAKK